MRILVFMALMHLLSVGCGSQDDSSMDTMAASQPCPASCLTRARPTLPWPRRRHRRSYRPSGCIHPGRRSHRCDPSISRRPCPTLRLTSPAAATRRPGKEDGEFITLSGRRLTPAGRNIRLDGYPGNVVVHPSAAGHTSQVCRRTTDVICARSPGHDRHPRPFLS